MEELEATQCSLVLLRTKPYFREVAGWFNRLHAWVMSLYEDVLMGAKVHGLYSRFPVTWGVPPDVLGLDRFLREREADLWNADATFRENHDVPHWGMIL
jgi:hypothetical protein